MGKGNGGMRLKSGWREECIYIEDPVAPVGRWVQGLYSSPLSLFLPLLLFWKLPSCGARRCSCSTLSLLTLSFPPQSAPLTGGAGAVMDDALSESDNIFSQSPKRDRAASEAGRSWPLSVFVRSICCVQSPLSRPPYRLHWACANWSWPRRPVPSKSAQRPCHSG